MDCEKCKIDRYKELLKRRSAKIRAQAETIHELIEEIRDLKENRDVQTVKERQDWLISEYDLEVKRLTAERDKAIEAMEFWGKAFAHEPEDVAALKKENLKLKRDKRELLEELRRMKHENEMLWNYRVNRERKGY